MRHNRIMHIKMISSIITFHYLRPQCSSLAWKSWRGQRQGNALSRHYTQAPADTLLKAMKSADEVEPVPPLLLSPLSCADELQQEEQWVANMVRVWLDEEWAPLEVHRELGQAAGQAYAKLRQQGQDDVSDLVLSLSSELLSFNYRDTFVNAYEVSNKVVELLMLRQGCEVCSCGSDPGALQRYEEVLRLEAGTAAQ